MRTYRFVGILLVALLAVASIGVCQGTLDELVDEALRASGYQDGHWGFLVVDRASGDVLFERHADRMFSPASTTKLYTTAAALVGLGVDFRFETPVKRTREVGQDGAMPGDLILVASGDLSLGGRTGPDGKLLFVDNDHSYAGGGSLDAQVVNQDPLAPLAGLDSLAREVASGGIKSIQDVIVDDRLFEAAPSSGSGPARVSPIVINDNLIDVVITPAEQADAPATVTTIPVTSFVTYEGIVETGPPETKPSIEVVPVGPRRFQVRGRLPVGHAPVVKVYEVQEPADFARAVFIETLRRHAVRVAASPLGSNPLERLPSRAEVDALPKVAQYTSPPLSEYVKVILKVSQNLHASTLPMLLAARSGQRTLDAGLRRQGELLRELGIPEEAVSLGGGAGGSRSDFTTPRATVALLRAMDRRPEAAMFESALPILGQDGTLADVVDANSPARRHVRGKTGTYFVGNGLNGKAVLTSKALAGYMETAQGRPLVFAMFVNNLPLDAPSTNTSVATRDVGRFLGRLCELFHAGVPPDPTKPALPDPPPAETSEAGS